MQYCPTVSTPPETVRREVTEPGAAASQSYPPDPGHLTEPVAGAAPGGSPLSRPQADLIPLVAALAWGAAFVHAAVTPEHFAEEPLLHGLFFVVVATLQLIWGAMAYRRPSRRVLLAGVRGNCLLIAIWLLSRTTGLPAGLDSWQREPVAFPDVVATLDELAVVLLVAGMLAPGGLRLTNQRLRLASIVVGILLTASLFAPLGAHHHG